MTLDDLRYEMKKMYLEQIEQGYIQLRGLISKEDFFDMDLLKKINDAETRDVNAIKFNFDDNFNRVFEVEK